jgi:hypothetical protein
VQEAKEQAEEAEKQPTQQQEQAKEGAEAKEAQAKKQAAEEEKTKKNAEREQAELQAKEQAELQAKEAQGKGTVVPETDDDEEDSEVLRVNDTPYIDDNKDDDSTDGDNRGSALLGDQLQHMGVAAGTEDDEDTASCEADDMEEEANEKTGKDAVDKEAKLCDHYPDFITKSDHHFHSHYHFQCRQRRRQLL